MPDEDTNFGGSFFWILDFADVTVTLHTLNKHTNDNTVEKLIEKRETNLNVLIAY